MFDAKKFFKVCCAISLLILLGNGGLNYFQTQPKLKENLEFQVPFSDQKNLNQSEDLTHCSSPVSEVAVTYKSQVYLAKRFLPELNDQTLVDEILQHHAKYRFGLFNLNPSTHADHLYLNSKRPKIISSQIRSGRYPEKIVIRNELNETSKNPYLSAALQAGGVSKGESAWIIDYEAQIFATVCGELKENKLPLTWPKDPYLAYWAPGQNDFTQQTFENSNRLINPCSAPEMVEIKWASWFWYTFSPQAESCRNQLQKTKFYATSVADVAVLSVPKKVEKDFFPALDLYEVSMIFGTIKNKDLEKTMALLKKDLNPQNLLTLDERLKTVDHPDETLLAFAMVLREISRSISGRQVTLDIQDNVSLTAHVEGELKNKKKIRFNIFYGLTSIDYLISPAYLAFATSTMATSDFITYTGHAGMGQNYSLQFWSWKSGIPLEELQKRAAAKKAQVFLLVSCYSSIYFGEDILAVRNNQHLKTLMIRSAAPDYIFQTSVGLLHFLKQDNLNDIAIKSYIEPFDLGRTLTFQFR